MSDQLSDQMKVRRDVDASPEQIFALLADPARHPEIDGAGMLRGVAAGSPVSAIGDEFTMNMNNSILDDYQVTCRVTAFEPGRRIGWSPCGLAGDNLDRLGDMTPGGHSFTFELEPNGTGGTTVTQIYDWSGVADPKFRTLMPFLKEEQLAESLEMIGKAAG